MSFKSELGAFKGHWKWHHSMDHVHSYYSAVVNIALYFTILEIFDVKNVMILKSRLGGRSPCAEIYKKSPGAIFYRW